MSTASAATTRTARTARTAATACTDIEIIIARGSLETGWTGATLTPIAEGIASQSSVSSTIYGVPYRAAVFCNANDPVCQAAPRGGIDGHVQYAKYDRSAIDFVLRTLAAQGQTGCRCSVA